MYFRANTTPITDNVKKIINIEGMLRYRKYIFTILIKSKRMDTFPVRNLSLRSFRDQQVSSHCFEETFIVHSLHLVFAHVFSGQGAFYRIGCFPSCC